MIFSVTDCNRLVEYNIIIVNYGIMSPTLNVNPILFVIPCKVLRGLWIYCYLPSGFSFIHDNIASQVADKRRWGFDQWMNSSIIRNVCSLIHPKCQPKRCHSDIKYHMTLNTIFSVAVSSPYSLYRWVVALIRSWDPCMGCK